MKCARCGVANPDDAIECQKCGEVLLDLSEETMEDKPRDRRGSTTARSPMEVETELVPKEQISSATARKKGSSSGSGVSSPSAGSATGGQTYEFPPATVLAGRYEIVQLVGRGGMGLVYKVRDLELDRIIALKTIRSEKLEDPAMVQRFKRELVLSRKVTHRNVVRIHDLGEAEGFKFITMEFIEGESLKSVIRRRGTLPPDEIVDISRQILAALEEAHRQGVIHRDLKPQNIVIDKNGAPRLMDFGIARSEVDTAITTTGMMIGTPDYMSPEQVKGEKAGAASDLFSFGVILYEMVTGDLPYQGETPMSKVMARLSHKPRMPREITANIPAYLDQIIRSA